VRHERPAAPRACHSGERRHGGLCKLWPATFALPERNRKPLALGIHGALLTAVEPAIDAGTVTVQEVKAALRRYVSAEGYLRACRRAGTARIDLAGNVVGTVTPVEAAHARQVLQLRKAARRANVGLASTKNGPRTAATANGPISANVMHYDKSTSSDAGASPAA
jgi:sRNA-binding protein